MPAYTIYDAASGEIVMNLTAGNDAEALANAKPGQMVVEGEYRSAQVFFSNGIAVARMAMSPQVNGATITGLPEDAELSVHGKPFVKAGGSSFTVNDMPSGQHFVLIRAPKYREVHVRITV